MPQLQNQHKAVNCLRLIFVETLCYMLVIMLVVCYFRYILQRLVDVRKITQNVMREFYLQ